MSIKLSSERLYLRLITIEDLSAIHHLHSYPEVNQFNTLGIPVDINNTREVIIPWIKAHEQQPIKHYTFAIINKSTNDFLGLFGLKQGPPKNSSAEIWYKLIPKYWKQGFATESTKCILDFAFQELNLHRVTAGCAVDNIGSIKVLEKVGMTREGRCRQILPLQNGWSDNYEYAILEVDWME